MFTYRAYTAGEVTTKPTDIDLFLWRCGPTRARASSFKRFLDHSQWRTTVGRTPRLVSPLATCKYEDWNFRNYSSARCCVQVCNLLSDCKGRTEAEGSDVPCVMFLSPAINQHLRITLCTLNHTSFTAATHFGDPWHLPQVVPSNCTFFATHQMPKITRWLFVTRAWTPPHVGAVTDTWFGVNTFWLINGDWLRVLKNTQLKENIWT
jgi:hypothetical protein